MKSKNLLTIGIDLGGTKIATGLVGAGGKLLAEDRRPTKAPNHAGLQPKDQISFLINSMADAVLEIVQSRTGKTLKAKSQGILGIGLAAAGPLDVEKGLLVNPANFGNWTIVPIVKLLTAALKKRGLNFTISFQNDAIAAALGEGWVGVSKKCVSHAMITLGTGVGTGVILNGKPSQSRGMGSEWGHMICDHSEAAKNSKDFFAATVEGLASGTGMFLRAQRKGFKGESMQELAGMARIGDPIAKEIFGRASQALAALFYNLSIGYHVDKFAITGGLLPIQDLFVPQAIEQYKSMMEATFPEFLAPIVVSSLGNKAGVIGAARLPYLE